MCTTNVYSYVYPDGRKETSRRPNLCPESRRGVPCSGNIVFQHPTSYVPTSTVSSPYLPPQGQFPPTPSYTPRSTTPNFRSGDESDRGYRSGSATRSRRHSGAVYVNGQKVYDLERGQSTSPRRSSGRERIVLIDNPPTARTPPKTYATPLTAPPSPSFPTSPRRNSLHRRPVIVDERLRAERPRVEIEIVDPASRRNSHSRHASTSSHDSRRSHDEDEAAARRRRRERKQKEEEAAAERRQALRNTKLRDRIAKANAEILNRPAVPMPPAPRRASDGRPAVLAPRASDLVEAVRGLNIEERPGRCRAQVVEDEAQRQRLMERMMPQRRATVGPGSRRHRVLYDDGMYRWE